MLLVASTKCLLDDAIVMFYTDLYDVIQARPKELIGIGSRYRSTLLDSC